MCFSWVLWYLLKIRYPTLDRPMFLNRSILKGDPQFIYHVWYISLNSFNVFHIKTQSIADFHPDEHKQAESGTGLFRTLLLKLFLKSTFYNSILCKMNKQIPIIILKDYFGTWLILLCHISQEEYDIYVIKRFIENMRKFCGSIEHLLL